jgi:hypothetical protein
MLSPESSKIHLGQRRRGVTPCRRRRRVWPKPERSNRKVQTSLVRWISPTPALSYRRATDKRAVNVAGKKRRLRLAAQQARSVRTAVMGRRRGGQVRASAPSTAWSSRAEFISKQRPNETGAYAPLRSALEKRDPGRGRPGSLGVVVVVAPEVLVGGKPERSRWVGAGEQRRV